MFKRPLLLIAIVVGLVAASLVAISMKPATLGLDLQGGVEVVLQGQPTDEADVTPEAIERSVEIIRDRVDAFGVAEPEIQTQGSDQIVVALPGAEDPDRVVRDLIQPAQLVFINFSQNIIGPPNGTDDFMEAVRTAQRADVESERGRQAFYAADRESGDYVSGPEFERRALIETLPAGTDRADIRVVTIPPGVFLAYTETTALATRENSRTERTWFVFENNPNLVGADITESRASVQQAAGGGTEPIVTMSFTGAGQRKFQDATRQLWLDGNLKGQSEVFAIILDGEIVSTPQIDHTNKALSNGIDGRNGALIEGGFTSEEASTLAKQINSGALPITLEPISTKTVGATLGAESLQQGLIAGLAGLVLVMLFLIAYYRFLGLVAALALVIYGILLYAVMVLIPVTLTLPGIAGVILTIGVASDANVVIFERVREESRSGKSPKAAILAGYRRGITAILDANVVTMATAAILFLFATAGVKGFALTLLIGTLLSLFTAVVATQAVFSLLSETRFLRDDRYMALNQREVQWKMDFVGRWKLWLAISFIPMLLSAGWIGVKGLELGIEFSSGTRISSSFEQQPTEDQVRAIFTANGLTDAKIQATSENVDGSEVVGFQVQTRELTQDELSQVTRALDDEFGVVQGTLDQQTVGATFGKQIVRNAIWAIVLSFIVLIIYLTIRFEYKLALPALLTVVHDTWLALGIYSLTGREVTSATVAALLTILGYSLYDVVIVFDRIRENVPLMRKATYRQVVNRSVHDTLNRSIITTLTTLIPLTVLFFFGGDTLKDFAFALIVGMLTGAISSLAIAAPMAALWKQREPEYKRRATKAERRAQARVNSDSDVVDLDVLERAERGLAAELAIEEGTAPDPKALGSGRVGDGPPPPDDAAPSADEGSSTPVDATADGDPSVAPEGGQALPSDGGDAPKEERPAGRRPRPSNDPERPRRHQQVQRRKRR